MRRDLHKIDFDALPTELTKDDLPYVPNEDMPEEFDIDAIYLSGEIISGRSADGKCTVQYEDGEVVFVQYRPNVKNPMDGLDDLVSRLEQASTIREILWVRGE